MIRGITGDEPPESSGDGIIRVEAVRRRHHVVVVPAFVAAVINWQMEHRLFQSPEWGKLCYADLSAMGISLPNAPDAVEAATEGPQSRPTGITLSSATARTGSAPMGGDTASREEATGEPTPQQRGRLEGMKEQLGQILGERATARRLAYSGASGSTQERRQQRTAAGDAVTAAHMAEVEQISQEIGWMRPVLDVDHDELTRHDATIANWIRVLRTTILRLLNESEEASSGRHRRANVEIEAARAELEERDLVVGERVLYGHRTRPGGDPESDLDLEGGGYNPRLIPSDRRGEPGVTPMSIAGEQSASLRQLQSKLKEKEEELREMLAGDSERLRQMLLGIAGTRWTSPTQRNRTFRPRRLAWLARQEVEDAGPERLSWLANRWIQSVPRAVTDIEREVNAVEPFTEPIMRINRQAVIVDLHRTGVEICWATGSTLPTSQMHLDPAFAEKMADFLTDIRGLGVTKMFSAGFLRAPMSPGDSHPAGRACDIVGFEINGNTLRLAAHAEASDWYNSRDHLGGAPGAPTHRDVMIGMAERMRDYFQRIVGPGHNNAHQNHWHVEITAYEAEGPPTMYSVAELGDQPDFVRSGGGRIRETRGGEGTGPSWEGGGAGSDSGFADEY